MRWPAVLGPSDVMQDEAGQLPLEGQYRTGYDGPPVLVPSGLRRRA